MPSIPPRLNTIDKSWDKRMESLPEESKRVWEDEKLETLREKEVKECKNRTCEYEEQGQEVQ